MVFLHRVGGPLLLLSFSHGKCLLSTKLVKEKLGTKHEIFIKGLLQNNDGFESLGKIPLYRGIGEHGYYILENTMSSFYVAKVALTSTPLSTPGDIPSGSGSKTSPM